MATGMPGEVVLETDRLVLRRFTRDDVDALVELDSDPEVTHFITNGAATPREEVEDDILPRFLWYYATYPGYGFWAVTEKATGEFIGWFHLRPNPDHPIPDEPELGYRLRRAAWGNGYATEGWRCRSCRYLGPRGRTCPVCKNSMDLVDDVVEEAVEEALANKCRVQIVRENADLDVLGRIGAVLRF